MVNMAEMRYFCWNIVKIAERRGLRLRPPCLRPLGASPPPPMSSKSSKDHEKKVRFCWCAMVRKV